MRLYRSNKKLVFAGICLSLGTMPSPIFQFQAVDEVIPEIDSFFFSYFLNTGIFAQKEVENIPLFKWSLFVQNSISFCLIIGKEKSRR